jgi:hypothetical protein
MCDVFFADLFLILLHCCDKYELIASIDRFVLCCESRLKVKSRLAIAQWGCGWFRYLAI